MNILCITRPEVKPTRRTVRSAARFGQGILPTRPLFTVPFTEADEAWAAEVFNATPGDYDRHVDALAAEAMATDRLVAGCLL